MKFHIPQTGKDREMRDAAVLTQRVFPLAQLYQDIYKARQEEDMSDKCRSRMSGWLLELSDNIVIEILRLADEEPYHIPEESGMTK